MQGNRLLSWSWASAFNKMNRTSLARTALKTPRRLGTLRGNARSLCSTTNPYTILGVSPQASKKDVRNAYKKLAMRYHPDRPGGDETR